MITALLFAGISLGLVWLVKSDCQADLGTISTNDLPDDRPRRD